MTSKVNKHMTSSYAKMVYNENPEEYKLLIQAKVERHYNLYTKLYMLNSSIYRDISLIDTIHKELNGSSPDGYCMHPSQYIHKIGSFNKCSCCRKIVLIN